MRSSLLPESIASRCISACALHSVQGAFGASDSVHLAMNSPERADLAPEEPTEATSSIAPKGRQVLAKVRRELSEEEFTSPAAQRLLVDELERLEREAAELRDFRRSYYVERERRVVLEERARKTLVGEVIFGTALSLAGASLGYAPVAWDQQPTGLLALIFGLVLLVMGIIARVIQK